MKPLFPFGIFEMMIVLKWEFCLYYSSLSH